MKKPKLPKGIEDVKTAVDALYLIGTLTESYSEDTGSPEDRLIHQLREIALLGMQKDNENVSNELRKLALERLGVQSVVGSPKANG